MHANRSVTRKECRKKKKKTERLDDQARRKGYPLASTVQFYARTGTRRERPLKSKKGDTEKGEVLGVLVSRRCMSILSYGGRSERKVSGKKKYMRAMVSFVFDLSFALSLFFSSLYRWLKYLNHTAWLL